MSARTAVHTDSGAHRPFQPQTPRALVSPNWAGVLAEGMSSAESLPTQPTA